MISKIVPNVLITFVCISLAKHARGIPVVTTISGTHPEYLSGQHPGWNQTDRPVTELPVCATAQLPKDSYVVLESGHVVVPAHNMTYEPFQFKIIGDNLCLLSVAMKLSNFECLRYQIYKTGEFELMENGSVLLHQEILEEGSYALDGESLKVCDNEIFGYDLVVTVKPTVTKLNCSKQWYYDPDEFEILSNGSVALHGEIMEVDTYIVEGEKLRGCAIHIGDDIKSPTEYAIDMALLHIGQVGSIISLLSLCVHLCVFSFVSSLRNLPGWNLASMSFAYFLGYGFNVIGQIPQVLGVACVVSAAIVQYSFLAAFFWMNVMTIDVWRALRLATKKLISTDNRLRARKFLLYSSYAWGTPLIFTLASMIVEYSDDLPDDIKPKYGRYDRCWFTNGKAKAIFFVGPAFGLMIINAFFFIVCIYMIATNTMKHTSEHHTETRSNFFLYTRLGLIMGVMWSIGILGAILNRREIWFIFDILNSLQGFFVLLCFSCSRKVWKHFKRVIHNDASKSTITKTDSQ